MASYVSIDMPCIVLNRGRLGDEGSLNFCEDLLWLKMHILRDPAVSVTAGCRERQKRL